MSNIKTEQKLNKIPQPVKDEKENNSALSIGTESVRIDGKLHVQVPASQHNTDQFLVVDGGEVKTRTGAEVLSDIGDAGGDITQVSFTSADDFSAQTISSGNADFVTNGSNGVTTSMTSGPIINISGTDASTSAKGVASFSSNNFDVSSGAVTIKDGGVDLTAEVTGVLPSANMDSDTAHLTTNQTFTGSKTFNTAFPQVKFTDDSLTDKVEVGLSGDVFYHKTGDTGIDFKWRDNSNNDIVSIDTSAQTLTIGESTQSTYALKIGDNGRMNMPVRGFEFENAHGYFSPTGDMFLPIFISGTQTDLIRFQTPLTWEYYDYSASAYVDDMSNVSNLKNMLDGRRSTVYAVSNTKRKFRFVIERASSWAHEQTFYIENTWSSIGTFSSSASGGGSLTPTATIERLDGSFDASDDSNNDWTTNAGITTDWHTTGIWTDFGLAMYHSTSLHNTETHIRVTVTFPEYADTSKEINIKNIGLLSSYTSVETNQLAFKQDFDRNATGFGHLNIPSGHEYKINSSSVLSATTLGSGVTASSLTSVGTISSGTWNGTAIASAYLDSDTAHLTGSQTFSGTKTFSAGTIFGGNITLNADNKIQSDTTGANNFIEFDNDDGSPENQTIVSSVTNVALIVDGNGNDTGQFEVLKAGTDSTATELFRIENDGDAVFTGDISVSGTVDGRDLATDGSKLDGIEASATADQTKSDIDGLGITTVGTIDTGVWNGTAIANAYVADLPTSKITSGTFDDARISASSVTQHTPSIHWTRSTGGYFTANNTSRYTQSWEGDETWGNTVSITTALGGAMSVNYSDVYGGIWIAPAAAKITKSSIVVRAVSYADDITIKLWKINPADLRIYAINSVDITMPNTSSIVTSNTDLSSGNEIEENYVLLATMEKQATTGSSRIYFTWTISGTYD